MRGVPRIDPEDREMVPAGVLGGPVGLPPDLDFVPYWGSAEEMAQPCRRKKCGHSRAAHRHGAESGEPFDCIAADCKCRLFLPPLQTAAPKIPSSPPGMKFTPSARRYYRTAGTILVYTDQPQEIREGKPKVACYRADTDGWHGWLKLANLTPAKAPATKGKRAKVRKGKA